MQILYCIFLVVLLALLWSYVDYTPTAKPFSRAYGLGKDSICTLFSRIEWANHYKARLSHVRRYLFGAIVTTFLILIVYSNGFPNGLKLLQCIFVAWVAMFAFYQYTQHHGDKYAHYAIDRNVKILRYKLKVKKAMKNPPPETNLIFPLASDCLNFTYKSS